MQEYGFSLIQSVFIRKNMGQWKPVFSHVLCREGANISHKNDWWVVDTQNDDTNFLISQVEALKLVEY